MTNANAEAQRRWRQRQKEKRKNNLKKVGLKTEVFNSPFHEFFGDQGYDLDFELPLALAGIEPPRFEDDRGPEAFVLADETVGVEDPFSGATGSLGRAEIMVGCLIDSAMSLAKKVNEYKRKEINARLAEIEASDLSEPAAKKAALQDAARLHKMLDQLDKQVRWTFPQWKVMG
jgi:hypothetical protein